MFVSCRDGGGEGDEGVDEVEGEEGKGEGKGDMGGRSGKSRARASV